MEFLLIILLVLFMLPMFFTMRKQRQRQNEIISLQQSLAPGHEVITAGGLYGTVVDATGPSISLEVAPNVIMRVDRTSIIRKAEDAAAAQAAAYKAAGYKQEEESVVPAAEQDAGQRPVDPQPTETDVEREPGAEEFRTPENQEPFAEDSYRAPKDTSVEPGHPENEPGRHPEDPQGGVEGPTQR